jgi:hypothetical protein
MYCASNIYSYLFSPYPLFAGAVPSRTSDWHYFLWPDSRQMVQCSLPSNASGNRVSHSGDAREFSGDDPSSPQSSHIPNPESENENALCNLRSNSLLDDRAIERISTNHRVMSQLINNPVMVDNSPLLLMHNLKTLRSSTHQSSTAV